MFRDGPVLRNEDHVHVLLNHSALGDTISSLPALRWMRENNTTDIGLTAYTPEHLHPLVSHLMADYENLKIKRLDEWRSETDIEAEAGPAVMNAIHKNYITRNKMDLTDFAHIVMLDRLPVNDSEREYPWWPETNWETLDKFEELTKEKYVVLSSGATSDNKIFHPAIMADIVRYVRSQGLRPVILGKSTTIVRAFGEKTPLRVRDQFDAMPTDVKALCLDLRDKTTVMEARDIIAKSECMFGVDGGLLHLAGTTTTSIVYGITSVDPIHRGIVRLGEMNWRLKHVTPRNLKCIGCQSHWTLMYKHDFRFCGYEDYLCVQPEQLRSEDFIAAFEQLMETHNDY